MKDTVGFITKILVPKRRHGTVRRARLLDAVRKDEGGWLTVIRAPAGFGKTTLLVDLAHETASGVCWISLDEWDSDAATLVQYLRLSVARHLGQPNASNKRTPPLRDPHTVIGELITQIAAHDRQIIIFLDDFHCVGGSQQTLDLIDRLAKRLPLNCHLLLASRTKITLPSLARLILEGRAQEIGPSDLTFTKAEIKEYYRSARGEEISNDDVDRILASTEGWPAGVTLCRPGELGEPLRLAPDVLSEYLASEIYGRLPAELQEFLLQTSIYDTLEASGCEAILEKEGVGRLLEMLDSQNVPLVRVQGVAVEYKVHPLFRDFLRSKLRAADSNEYRRLNQAAGSWQANRGRASEAIRHFAEAEDWDQVATVILEQAPAAHRTGRWQTVLSWLGVIPAKELRKRKNLRLWEARILVRLGEADRALQAISEALDGLGEPDLPAIAELETIRGMALRMKGDVAWALASCQRAVDLAAKGNATMDILADARKQLGQVQFAQGSFSEAAAEFRAALDIYEHRGNSEETASVSGCLGSVLGSLGDLSESVSYLDRARQLWRKIGNTKELCWVLNNLAMIYYLMGQIDLAGELFLDAHTKARESGHQRIEAYALASLADIDRAGGDQQRAMNRYEEALHLAGELGEMTLSTYALTGLAWACSQAGDIGRAETLARQALVSARERQAAYEEGLAQLALGNIHRQRGNPDDARDAFSRAASLFEEVGAPREQAEALFYLADAVSPVRSHRRLLRPTLEKLAVIAQGLGYDYFLVEAARKMPAVVEYAASKRIAGGFYRELLRKRVGRRPADSGSPEARDGVRGRFPRVDVMALGDLEIRLEQRRVLDLEWESEKSKELFLLLLMTGRPLRKDEIVAALWPEAGGDKANSLFHSTLYRVRRALYPECVVESGGSYALNAAGSLHCDVKEFERLAGAAVRMTDSDPGYADTLGIVTDLYRGPFAPALESEWADVLRRSLEERFLDLIARLGDRLFQQKAYGEAIKAWQRFLEYDPYNEAACYKLMRALVAREDYQAALRTYRRYGEMLRTDIGEGPGPLLVDLYREVRLKLGPTPSPP